MADQLNNNTDCCQTDCDNVTVNTPGPAGNDGNDGKDGAAGASGADTYTRTTAGFTMPAVDSNVAVSVLNASPYASPQIIFIDDAGYFEVVGTAGGVVTVKNVGYACNAAPATVFGTNLLVAASGPIGPAGADGTGLPAALDAKGDIVVHDGTIANVLSPGANGELLFYNSAEPLGIEARVATFSDIGGNLDLATQVTGALPLASVGNVGGSAGDIQYWNGANWARLAPPLVDGDLLIYDLSNNKPNWGSAAASTTTARYASGRVTFNPAGSTIANGVNIASAVVTGDILRVVFTAKITANNPIVIITPYSEDAAGCGARPAKSYAYGVHVVLEDFLGLVDPVTYPNGYIDFESGVVGTVPTQVFNISIIA